MPASRSARAMIFAPRSCPSRPGLATTTRIFLWVAASMRGRDSSDRRGIPMRRCSLATVVGGGCRRMLLACSLAVLALSGSPGDGRHLETTLQDDAVMLHSAPALVREAARRIAWLGADRVRITAGWSALAPAPAARTRPGAPFDPADSRTYPREPWIRLDRAVKASKSAGLDVMLDVAFWAPRWAVQRAVKPADRQTWGPNATQFGHFAAAVARRYDGSFPDPERPGEPL